MTGVVSISIAKAGIWVLVAAWTAYSVLAHALFTSTTQPRVTRVCPWVGMLDPCILFIDIRTLDISCIACQRCCNVHAGQTGQRSITLHSRGLQWAQMSKQKLYIPNSNPISRLTFLPFPNLPFSLTQYTIPHGHRIQGNHTSPYPHILQGPSHPHLLQALDAVNHGAISLPAQGKP